MPEVIETNAPNFARQMRKYAEIYGPRHDKGLGEIVVERAGKLAFELYKQAKAIAPTKAQIAADVQKLGWRIPKEFPDGRMGRGEPRQWANFEIDTTLPKMGRGRKSTERRAQEQAIRAQKPTLTEMQNFVINFRSKHSGFVASGWTGALHDLGVYGGGGNRSRYGGATTTQHGSDVTVYLVNDAPGVTEANAKYDFVSKAIDAQIKDMGDYISTRLHQERLAA